MMLPAALHGWAPSFGQWCSFAISSLRWAGSTYSFRAYGVDAVQAVAIRLELVHPLPAELRGGHHRDVVLLARREDRRHAVPPFAVAQDMVVNDERPDVRRPEDPIQVGERTLHVDGRIVLRDVRHRAIDVQRGRLRVDGDRKSTRL